MFTSYPQFAFKLNRVVNDRLNCCINTHFLRAIFPNADGQPLPIGHVEKTNDQGSQHASRVTQIAAHA